MQTQLIIKANTSDTYHLSHQQAARQELQRHSHVWGCEPLAERQTLVHEKFGPSSLPVLALRAEHKLHKLVDEATALFAGLFIGHVHACTETHERLMVAVNRLCRAEP